MDFLRSKVTAEVGKMTFTRRTVRERVNLCSSLNQLQTIGQGNILHCILQHTVVAKKRSLFLVNLTKIVKHVMHLSS